MKKTLRQLNIFCFVFLFSCSSLSSSIIYYEKEERTGVLSYSSLSAPFSSLESFCSKGFEIEKNENLEKFKNSFRGKIIQREKMLKNGNYLTFKCYPEGEEEENDEE